MSATHSAEPERDEGLHRTCQTGVYLPASVMQGAVSFPNTLCAQHSPGAENPPIF